MVGYSALCSSLESRGYWQPALQTAWGVRARGLKTDVVFCNAIISSMEKGCQWRFSAELLGTMRQRGHEPSHVTLNAAMSSLEKVTLVFGCHIKLRTVWPNKLKGIRQELFSGSMEANGRPKAMSREIQLGKSWSAGPGCAVAWREGGLVHVCLQDRGQKFRVDVPGFDGEFRQVLVAARAAALFAAQCCAVVSLDGLEGEDAQILEALPLMPRDGLSFVQAAWHPMSDAHLGMLSSDGSWSLLNLSTSASIQDPELHFPKIFETEEVVDFAFVPPGEERSPEDAWLSLSVFFLAASGRVALRNPVLPAVAVMSHKALRAFAADSSEGFAREWLLKALARREVIAKLGADAVVIHHQQHLHGTAPMVSSPENQLIEDGALAAQARSFCSVQVATCSGLVLVARAASCGLVEILALEQCPGPDFQGRKIRAKVVEEIDLMCSKPSAVRLSVMPGIPTLFSRSSSLLAAIELPRLGSGTGTWSSAGVNTLAELRSEGSEFAGWQPESGRGVLLRVERRGRSATSSLQHVELQAKQEESSTPSAPKTDPLQLLEKPLVTPKVAGKAEKAEDLAKGVADLRSGLANLAARKQLLQHLARTLPARAEAIRSDLDALGDASSGASGDASASASRAAALQARQAELAARQRRLVAALHAELEAQSLEAQSLELPPLWARLHELRQATELLAAARPEGHEHRPGLKGFEGFGPAKSIRTTAQHLQSQLADAEVAVAAAYTWT
ncbi:unnamed protein product [Effrenium voratum]|uniref:Pentatricopeptide repeat-containing protein, chloroplastic n=1 Tax=Effrenium voratum TaxID=2562239 RepID=A0AA36MWB8_9DINO|nr:unnamed protein product [Effrenium voratum]